MIQIKKRGHAKHEYQRGGNRYRVDVPEIKYFHRIEFVPTLQATEIIEDPIEKHKAC